jgi:hypothetical protein
MPQRKLRSRAYPVIPLEEALELLKQQTEVLGWGYHDRNAIAQALGYVGGNSGIAARKIAALVHFGLLGLRSSLYSPTSLAHRILEVTEGNRPRAALQAACLNPSIFREIIQRYELVGRIPRQLAAALTMDHGIQDNAREEAARVFMASAVFAGILEGNGAFREEYFETANRPRPIAFVKIPSSPASNLLALEQEGPREAPSWSQEFKFLVTDNKEVEIRLPAPLNEQDILILRAQIDVLELQVKLNRPDQPVRMDVVRNIRGR